MRYYIRTWIAFFSGANVIKVTNENEFNIFKKFLDDCGVLDLLKDDLTFKDWQHLAEINNKKTNLFLFEFDNYKGITWNDDLKNSIDYYGENPIEVLELEDFLNRRTIENNKSDLEKYNENDYDYN